MRHRQVLSAITNYINNKILRKLLLIICSASLISSCGVEDSSKNILEKNDALLEDIQEDIYDPILSEKWIKENTPSKDNDFIRFEYTLGSKEDYSKFKNILLEPYEKNEKKVKHSKMKITENKDSVTVSFWQNIILEGCYFTGNLEVKKDTLKLLFEKIYSPYQEITDGEIVLVHLKYIIRPQSQRNIIITENRNIK